MMFRPVICALFTSLTLSGSLTAFSVSAENLNNALARAYANNPDLEAARAGLRANDENIAIAKSGLRPTIALSLTAEAEDDDGTRTDSANISLSASQPLFDGFQTKNNVLATQARIMAARQSLISTEMDVFIAGIQSYIDVLLNQQILSLRDQNLEFLEEQLRGSKARLEAGEGTRTDISQAEASLAAAKAQRVAAETDVKAARATYKQVFGVAPEDMIAPSLPKEILPANLSAAIGVGLTRHPALVSARYSIEAAAFDVKALEGALLPGVDLSGSLSETDGGSTTASISARLSVPFFSGGRNYANIRRSQESLGQVQMQRDSSRKAVEQQIINAWVNFQSAESAIDANEAQVRAARSALSGLMEEQNVGQRTTLDVLNGQANLISAREALAISQRNLLVSAYNILYATGQLTSQNLGLNVRTYRPEEHFDAVKDKWFGLRNVTSE